MAALTLESRVRVLPLLHSEIRPDGVAVITLDAAGEAHNTITPQLGAELAAALETAEADRHVKAVVLRSGKDSFLVGANLDLIRKVRFAKDAEDASLEIGNLFARIASSGKPIVACVHGAALGGGFGLALACTATIATDDTSTQLGLPEVKLGLLPAANSLLRIAERAGLGVAIDLGLRGRNLDPKQALALGLVDDVVSKPIALETACTLALRLVARPEVRKALPGRRAWMRHRGSNFARLRDTPRIVLEQTSIGRAILFRRARAEAANETRGHSPATGRMLDVLQQWARKGFGPASALESRLFGELVVSETSHRLVELFFATSAVKKDPGIEPAERGAEARLVERVGVVGAGLMGAGIAYASVQAGLPVRMTDTDWVAVGRGLKYVKDVLDEQVRRTSMTALERDHTFARLSGTVDYSGIASADLVIEAVFEELTLKQGVVRELDKLVKDTCILASNTSSIPITQIAAASSRPDRILGMHYFSPVHRMPLLEVVRTKETNPRALATAVAVGKRQGKKVIVVHDGTGFYTTRILVPYLNEATQLLTEGVAIDAVDRALVDWGFSHGPLHFLDDIGIDVAAHVSTVMAGAFGERLHAPAALAALRSDDRKGRKNGRGFYLYGRGRASEQRVDDTVYQALRIHSHTRPMADEMSLRCILLLVNEAIRCLDEGILRSPRDGDVGAIFGLGFPPFRGGPFRYVDVLGAPEVLSRTRALEQRLGARFEPAPLLVEMARRGKRFY